MTDRGEPTVLSNEFATVEIAPDTRDGRQRLRVRSLVTGAEAYFDPLELELLASISHLHLRRMLAVMIEAPEIYVGAEAHDER